MTFIHYPVQEQAVTDLYDNYVTRYKHLNKVNHFQLLTAETGAGKTYVTAMYIKRYHQNEEVLLFVPETLVGKWKRVLEEVGCDTNLVTIVGLKKTMPQKTIEDLLAMNKEFSLIVWDEVHTAKTRLKKIAPILTLNKDAFFLGITATAIDQSFNEVRSMINFFKAEGLFEDTLYKSLSSKAFIMYLNHVFKYRYTVGFTKDDIVEG